jgi:hypothetical protein
MSLCLRCSKPCAATSVFCDECRLLLNYRLQQGESVVTAAPFEALPLATTSSEREESGMSVSDNPFERITGAHSTIVDAPTQSVIYTNTVEQAVNKLNAAAHAITEVEQPTRRPPHPSRLAPIYDVSTDIQRESTPCPTITKDGRGNQKMPGRERSLADRWTSLLDIDTDETGADIWSNHTDPLARRHLPSRAEAERIEKDYLRRARPRRLSPPAILHLRSRSRIFFTILAAIALLVMAANALLISVIFVQPHPRALAPAGLPTLIISPSRASIGQSVLLHVANFTPLTHILLTHDIEEAVQTSTASPLLQVDPNGAASVSFLVDDSWGPGFHTIGAEDVTTRYTASTTLQIIGAGPTRPSHLLIDNIFLDMGADMQGANTIQSLVLHNSGGGSISWTASSREPWLMVSPSTGMFSGSQVIFVAVERKNLKPGDYKSRLTISSNIGAPEHVRVEMTVRPLPANAGPVLVVSPALLSFVAIDGGPAPASQPLTINNPGSQTLNWSLSSNTLSGSGSFFPTPGAKTHWLSANQRSGVVSPGSTSSIAIRVDSEDLLPGVYSGMLIFTARHGALDSPQEVGVSLTVLRRCGLTTSMGNLSFTAVSGQANPANQALGLSGTSSCSGRISWHAASTARWLTLTPARGQLNGTNGAVTAVGVNIENLDPGTYSSTVAFSAGHSTQIVTVQLVVQNLPARTAPILGISASSLNFSNAQGQENPPGQVATITNNGGGTLYWHTTVNILGSSWLGASPSGGVVVAGKIGQITINVDTSQLIPGTYMGQITLIGTDAHGVAAAGSPQMIMVNLLVQSPCILAQPSSGALAFSAVLGNPDPGSQPVTMTASGNCAWPLSVHTNISNSASWLNLALSPGSITASGQPVTIQVAPSLAGLGPGSYSAQVSVTAMDHSGTQVQASPQTFSVTLTVSEPCALHVLSSPTALSFTVAQGQAAPPAQNLNFSETGGCAHPISWKAVGDTGSNSWLVLSSTTGTDSGNNSTVSVSVNMSNLAPGTYSGQITLSANDSDGNALQSSPQTVSVTLVVTGS